MTERLDRWLGVVIVVASLCAAAVRHAHRRGVRRRLRRQYGGF